MGSNTRRILIVDDNPENIKVVANTLHADHIELAFAESGEEALKRLEKRNFDLILMDVMMPQMDGFEAVQHIRKNPENDQIPIIFLTARNDEESIEKAFSLGGADYVCKPFRARELIVRVQYQLERKEFIEKLNCLATKDMLTGIYNRRKFFEMAETLLEQGGDEIYGAIADIDHFKSINDNYGHAVGDQVIRAVAKTIEESLNEKEAILGRIGGEEFAIVFLAKSMMDAFSCIDYIRKSIEALEFKLKDDSTIGCTISLGLASQKEGSASFISRSIQKRPQDQMDDRQLTLDQLLSNADQMLYEAKNRGRNRIGFRNRNRTDNE